MLCQRCQAAWLGPDGRCPGCDADPWRSPAPQQQAPSQPQHQPQQAYPSPYQQPRQDYGYPAGHPAAHPAPGYPAPAPGYPGFDPGLGYPKMAPAPPPVRVPGALATALYVLLGLCVIADLLALVASALEFSLFGRLEDDPGGVDIAEAEAVDAFYAVTAGGTLLLLLVTGIVFIVWLYRVRVNAETLGPAWPQRHGRGWAIGAWFTPIVNLWFPMRIVQDVWNASDPNAQLGNPYNGAGRVTSTRLVLAWWLAWTGSTLVTSPTNFLDNSTEVHDYSGMQTVYALEMLGGLLSVAAGVLAILVVRRITTMQGVRLAMVGGQTPGQGPGWGYPR